MPKLNDHGLGGGGGKALGVPVYPFENITALKNANSGISCMYYGENTATYPTTLSRLSGGSGCVIDNDFYVIGDYYSADKCFKYNVSSREWSTLSNHLYGTVDGERKVVSWSVPIGTTIYYGIANYIVKYDTLTDSHVMTKDVSSTYGDLGGSKACTDGAIIYIFGGGSLDGSKYAYKFTPSTNAISQLTNIPVEMYYHNVIYGGDGYCYLFGGGANPTVAYKYNISNNTYSKLTNIPFRYKDGAITRIGNYIYLIHSSASTVPYLYEYDITTGNYTMLSSSGVERRYEAYAGVIEGVIYVIGGGTNAKTGLSIIPCKASEITTIILNLSKGIKVHTNGDVMRVDVLNSRDYMLVDNLQTVTKSNGVVKIPTDGNYAIVGGNYATIGG